MLMVVGFPVKSGTVVLVTVKSSTWKFPLPEFLISLKYKFVFVVIEPVEGMFTVYSYQIFEALLSVASVVQVDPFVLHCTDRFIVPLVRRYQNVS